MPYTTKNRILARIHNSKWSPAAQKWAKETYPRATLQPDGEYMNIIKHSIAKRGVQDRLGIDRFGHAIKVTRDVQAGARKHKRRR